MIPTREEYYFDCKPDGAPLDSVQDSDSVPISELRTQNSETGLFNPYFTIN